MGSSFGEYYSTSLHSSSLSDLKINVCESLRKESSERLMSVNACSRFMQLHSWSIESLSNPCNPVIEEVVLDI